MFPKTLATVVLVCAPLTMLAQNPPTQTSTVLNSSITSSSTVHTPPKYFVDTLGLPDISEAKCLPRGQTADITFTPPKHAYLGDAPFKLDVKSSDGFPVKLQATGTAAELIDQEALKNLYIVPKGVGQVTLEVHEDSDCPNKAHDKPIHLNITDDETVCISGLEKDDVPKKADLDAAAIAQLLGNPYPYSFQATDDKILVYSARKEAHPDLRDFDRQIKQLVKAGAGSGGSDSSKIAYEVEVLVPHSRALGDLASKLGSLNYSDFKIQDVGTEKIRITSTKVPECSRLTAYLRDIRRAVWQPYPENFVDKLFHLTASDVTSALGAGSSGSSSSSGGGGSGSSGSGSGGSGSSGGGGTSGSANAGAGSSATTASAPAGTTTATATGAAGADGSSSASAGKSSAASSSSGSSGSGGSGGGSGGSGSNVSVAGVSTDMLLFNDAAPGDDSGVTEKKRLLTLLDLPRPEVILNVWSMQASSQDKELVGKVANETQRMVRDSNDVLQNAVHDGWQRVRNDIASQPNDEFFDTDFYYYLAKRYVAISPPEAVPPPEGVSRPAKETPDSVAARIIGNTSATDIRDGVIKDLCPPDKYCLGYTTLFKPINPRLTDLVLAVIASRDPQGEMMAAVNAMEGRASGAVTPDCVAADKQAYPRAAENNDDASNATAEEASASQGPSSPGRHFYLECFRNAAYTAFAPDTQPSLLNLLRSAVADFLFQYKISQIYSHEFNSYELSQSAHNLDSALAPLIDAFNRDLAVYQISLAEMVDAEAHSKGWIGGEKNSFINKGLITVRTISGIDTTVNTTSQNFLDATQMPTLSALASSIQGAKQQGSTSGHITDVFQNLTPVQAQVLLGAVAAFQSSKVQIGRSLNIEVTPRSLSGADSAELTVKLNADESASPTTYSSSGQGNAADISRVASHDTSTRIRVDSMKLFNVSTLTAELQKSRTRFPLLPPLVEIPYVGTLLGIPLPPAKEFHSSTAIISAIVVPTSTDIALGLTFTRDAIVDADGASACYWGSDTKSLSFFTDPHADVRGIFPRCHLRGVASFHDVNRHHSLLEFHERKLACFTGTVADCNRALLSRSALFAE